MNIPTMHLCRVAALMSGQIFLLSFILHYYAVSMVVAIKKQQSYKFNFCGGWEGGGIIYLYTQTCHSDRLGCSLSIFDKHD